MTTQDFMNFFRSDDFHQQMSTDDCVEVFRTVLKGSSDITPELISEVCSDYSVDDIDLAKGILANQGYATASLWTTTDVAWVLDEMLDEGEITKKEYGELYEQTLDIMNVAIDGEGLTTQINDDLRLHWIPKFLEELRSEGRTKMRGSQDE